MKNSKKIEIEPSKNIITEENIREALQRLREATNEPVYYLYGKSTLQSLIQQSKTEARAEYREELRRGIEGLKSWEYGKLISGRNGSLIEKSEVLQLLDKESGGKEESERIERLRIDDERGKFYSKEESELAVEAGLRTRGQISNEELLMKLGFNMAIDKVLEAIKESE